MNIRMYFLDPPSYEASTGQVADPPELQKLFTPLYSVYHFNTLPVPGQFGELRQNNGSSNSRSNTRSMRSATDQHVHASLVPTFEMGRNKNCEFGVFNYFLK